MREKDTCIQDMTKAMQWSCTDVKAYLLPLSYEALLDVGRGTDCLLNQLPSSDTRVHWETDLSQRLPFGDNTFDVVTCIHSFHQCPDPDKAMREVLRVLKPGGRYLLSDQRDGVTSLWRFHRRETATASGDTWSAMALSMWWGPRFGDGSIQSLAANHVDNQWKRKQKE